MEQNWRAGLAQDSRNKIVSRIMDTLQRHTPLSGEDGMAELWKIANRFEEKIFYAASDQHDYLRKISLKMLNLETRTENAPNRPLPSSSSGTRCVRPLLGCVDVTKKKRIKLTMEQNWRDACAQDSRNMIANRIMEHFCISSSISQFNSPSVARREQTPISARAKTPMSVEARRVYPKRERTPKVDVLASEKTIHRHHSYNFFVRRETKEFVEHVAHGANIRHFYCKIAGCHHATRPFPSKVRMEKHLLKCHALRLEIPDVRLAKKKIKLSKMPGRVDELLKHEAHIALSEYTSTMHLPSPSRDSFMGGYMRRAKEYKIHGSKWEGCNDQPIDLCTPTPKKARHVEDELKNTFGDEDIEVENVIEGKETSVAHIDETTIAHIDETTHVESTQVLENGPKERPIGGCKHHRAYGPPRRSSRLMAKKNVV